MAIFAILRTKQEIGIFVPSPTMPAEMKQIVSSPTASFRYIDDMSSLMMRIASPIYQINLDGWTERHKTGRYAGDLKMMTELKRITPGVRFYRNIQEPEYMLAPYKQYIKQ